MKVILEPQVKILKEDQSKLNLLIENITPALANSLRRTVLAEVPVMAIDDIVILENSSVLYDEILAHRIGLVPLVNDYDEIRAALEEDPLALREKEVAFVLDVVAEDEEKTVYSSDLKPKALEEEVKVSKVIRPASGKIPLVKLARGQRIVLEAYAHYGLGKQHAKWQPVSVAAFKYLPVISIDREKCILCGQCVEECPRKVFEMKEEGVSVSNPYVCSLCMSCVKICPTAAIKVRGREDAFIFKIESIGVLPPRDAFILSILVLKYKVRNFKKILERVVVGQETAS
ncbi:MAG: DNA-directed RNA polymerase subunit D [Thermoprotei archaeon]|nr:MAG: DNA-directed RNA polymerase subunit D [Thermoprotei archaeon]